jgi:hypothetical protein
MNRTTTPTWVALTVLAFSWFGLATLVSVFGPIQQVVHFYNLATVLRDPSSLVHGTGSHALEAFAFGTLSVAVLLAPLAAHRLGTRSAWLLYTLPLCLMVACGIILYAKTSQPYVQASPDAGALGVFVARVANNLIGAATDTIAKHISVGAGGYLSFAAALYLTLKGVQGYFSNPGILTFRNWDSLTGNPEKS